LKARKIYTDRDFMGGYRPYFGGIINQSVEYLAGRIGFHLGE